VPTHHFAGGMLDNAWGSEKDTRLQSGLCCEQMKEVEH
jgi:hypothetical protein